MIGSGYRKFAKSNDMYVARGVGYGALHGYAATLFEGVGSKTMVIAAKFPDTARRVELQNSLDRKALAKQYRVQSLDFSGKTVTVVFTDTVGTMKYIEAFTDWFFPRLEEYGATKANICAECGAEVGGGCWKLIDGVAYYFHPTCAEHACSAIRQSEQAEEEEDTGSYGGGIVGALLGSTLGAVLWAIILNLGYIAGLVGFVIGWLADRGYRLLHGKRGKGMVAILILAVIFGVVLGTVLTPALMFAVMALNGDAIEGVGVVSFDMIPAMTFVLMTNPGYLSSVVMNILMGLVFAALGVWGTIRDVYNEVSGIKIVDLP